jgi:hypothetical protein
MTTQTSSPERLPMTQDPKILTILRIHHALWNRETLIERNNQKYIPFIPAHNGYVSVTLPNEQGYNLLWITQNMNKSTYATEQIRRARSQGDDLRITWIVDNLNSKFLYLGCINTCHRFDGHEDIIIERYAPNEPDQVVWTNMPFYLPVKSKY